MQLPTKTLLALLPFFLQQANGQTASGTGTTTRYWDCCKPSCAWTGKASLLTGSSPVTTCDISNNPLTDYDTASGCNGGGAYQCSNESPWAVTDDLAYGYAAVNIAGGSESSWCCACYELTFTSGPVSGKKMIVQATNTGGDLGSNQFDISIPGGGVGIYNGCTAEWGAPSSGWGAQYGGISSRSDCDSFPAALQDGCYWRFDWFQAADNPSVSFKQVQCPAALSANTGCVRADDSAAALASAPTGSAVSGSSSAAKVAAVATSSSSSTPAAAVESSASSSVSSIEPASTTKAVSTESSIQLAISSTISETPSSSAVVPAVTSSIESSTSTTSSASSTSSTAAVSTEDSCEA